MPLTLPALPLGCPAIGDPTWHLPTLAEAPGGWLLLAALALVALLAARRMLAPLPSWRTRSTVALTYGMTALALLGAVLLLALVVPAYQDAAARQFWFYQPIVSPTALSCALTFQGLAYNRLTLIEQGAEILLVITLVFGGGSLWLRARWRTARPIPTSAGTPDPA